MRISYRHDRRRSSGAEGGLVTHRAGGLRIVIGLILVSGLAIAGSAGSVAGAAPKPKPTTTTTPGRGDTTPPTTPTDLRVTATTKTSVSLAWSPSTDRSSFSYVVRQDNSLSWTVSQARPPPR